MESVTQWLTPNRKSNGLQAARGRESPYLLLSVCFNSPFIAQNLVELILSCSSNRLLFFFGDHSVLSHVDASLMQPVPRLPCRASVETTMADRSRQSLEELKQPLLSSTDLSDDPYGKNSSFVNGYLIYQEK